MVSCQRFILKNNHDAIIEREIFDRVQAEKARRGGNVKFAKQRLRKVGNIVVYTYYRKY